MVSDSFQLLFNSLSQNYLCGEWAEYTPLLACNGVPESEPFYIDPLNTVCIS